MSEYIIHEVEISSFNPKRGDSDEENSNEENSDEEDQLQNVVIFLNVSNKKVCYI